MAPTSSPPLRTARASSPAYGSSGEGPFLRACWVSLRFLDRLLPNAVPPVFWFPLGLPCLQVDPMAARKGDLVLYFGDLFPTEARKLPSCPRSHSVNRKGKPAHPSAPLVDRCGFTKRLSTVHSR
ncbi:hypothetical protein CJ030_MR1G008480 [Morella rubra]|uniref:Uncharacterized protein n=1 Tax=Morella rubra TaxID=262757 RepID=A0A6A1WN45_9ROSI|nr:hypothetical protein CJ030_MR1G008480 [Morella rubra]